MRGYSSIRTTVVSRAEHPPKHPAATPFQACSLIVVRFVTREERKPDESGVYATQGSHSVSFSFCPRFIFFFFRIIFLDVAQTCTALVKFRGSTRWQKGESGCFGRRTCVGIKSVRRMTDRNVIRDNCRWICAIANFRGR